MPQGTGGRPWLRREASGRCVDRGGGAPAGYGRPGRTAGSSPTTRSRTSSRARVGRRPYGRRVSGTEPPACERARPTTGGPSGVFHGRGLPQREACGLRKHVAHRHHSIRGPRLDFPGVELGADRRARTVLGGRRRGNAPRHPTPSGRVPRFTPAPAARGHARALVPADLADAAGPPARGFQACDSEGARSGPVRSSSMTLSRCARAAASAAAGSPVTIASMMARCCGKDCAARPGRSASRNW